MTKKSETSARCRAVRKRQSETYRADQDLYPSRSHIRLHPPSLEQTIPHCLYSQPPSVQPQKETKMKTTAKPSPPPQKPSEPNPYYVALLLYLAAGPNRDSILTTGAGSLLWTVLFTIIDRTAEGTPLLTVCSRVSTVLQTIRRTDAVELMKPAAYQYADLKRYHNRLLADEQLLASIDTMLSALAIVQRRQSQPRFPGWPASKFAAAVETSPNRRGP